MFGPGVERRSRPTALRRPIRIWPDCSASSGARAGHPALARQGDAVAGLDDGRRELVRVPMREPVHILPAFDARYGVVRTNCP